MFKLLRYFSITSFVAMSITVILLGTFYRQVAIQQVIEMGESKNVELTMAFSNSLRSLYTPLLDSEPELSRDRLKDHPKIAELHRAVQKKMRGLSVIKVKIYNKDGLTVFSSDPKQIGGDKSSNPGFVSALTGQVISALTHRGNIYGFEGLIFDRDILSSYIPIRLGRSDASIEGVFELYADVTTLVQRVRQTQIKIVVGVTLILALLYVCLFFIVRYADRLLREQENHSRRREKALADQAIRDPLTDLYNRRHFDQRFSEEIARANRDQLILGVLLCDLDGFKYLNDTQGHQAGDVALKAVAKTLLDFVRGADLVFRWGGDEFMVVLPNTNRDGIMVVGERIRKGVGELGKKGYSDLDVSIGVAIYPEHGTQADELVQLVDRALYIAKKGGGKIHIGEEEYLLDDNVINVVFQPVMDVRLNQILGYEALSRDPSGKQSILQLFKKYHAIGKLHELKCLCFKKQLKTAQELGLNCLFINVDFKVLKKIDMPAKPPDMDVVLEISEGEVLHDVEDHLEVAMRWRMEGYKFAMDDFGAGFISLPFIARLAPDYIKLDRSTILQAVSSPQFKMVLKDLINGLRKVSKEGIVAEGIETEKELSVMKGMGVYLIQGYLFGKPEALNSPLPFRSNNLPPETSLAHKSYGPGSDQGK